MKRPLIFFLLFLSLLTFSTPAKASDFKVDGIYYNIISGTDKQVEVTSGMLKYSGAVVIPSTVTYSDIVYSVTTIGSSAFSNCSGLTSVIIPNSVTSIGKFAFSSCSNLDSVTIPNSVTSIGNYAFSGCKSLTSVTIPESVDTVGKYAFQNCSGLTSVTIPENVTSIGDAAFNGCSGLTSVEWNARHCGDFSSETRPFTNASLISSITFGNEVEHIPAYLCYNCSGLTLVTISNSVTSIGNNAFYNCSGLTEVTIPERVTSIGNYAFSGCSSLSSVTIPNSVTSIGNYAFNGCEKLTEMTIPNSVTSIGDAAFNGCSGLMSVTIGESVTSIGNGAFGGCSNLTSVTIPEGVTKIGSSTFQNCSGLTSVIIPNSVTSIESNAFYNCSSLTSVTSLAETPPSCGSSVFDVHDTLYVPCGSKAAYQTATGWLSFSKIIELECEDIVTDTLYFEFALEEGETSATIEYSFSNDVLSGIKMEYHDGQEHEKFTPTATGSITVNGNGHGWIYYTYAPGDTYSASFKPIEESEVSLQAEDIGRAVRAMITVAAFPDDVRFTSLDVSGCTALTVLDCENNQLTALNVSGCTALTKLICIYNKLITLDVSGCTALTQLFCSDNHLTALDVRQDTALEWLSCSHNQLTSLDVSQNKALKSLFCADNHIPLSTLYGIYTQRENWQNFFANNQTDIVTLSACEALDLSSDMEFGGQSTTFSLEDEDGNAISADTYTENDLVFQFKDPFTGFLTLENPSIPNASMTYHITAEECLVETFTVQLSVNNGAWGWATKTGNGTYKKDSSVTIIATPREGYRFVNWTREGEVFSINAVYTFAVTENLTLVANFEEIPEEPVVEETFTLYVLVNDATWGSVSQSGNGTYKKDSLATIIATPNEGYRFVNWTQADGAVFGTKADTTFKVVENLILVARFEKLPDEPEPPVEEDFTVTLTPNNPAWGLVFKTGNCTYGEGEEIKILALPYAGYRFVNWTKPDGSVFGTDSLITFKVTESLELTANFEKIPDVPVPVVDSFSVQVFSNNEAWGSVSQSGDGRYEKDSSVSITATPNEGYRFVNWTKDGAVFGTASDTTFAVTEDLELTANFEKIPDEKPIGDDFHIYVKDNVIYLSENRGKVQVFNVIGQCLYTGNTTAIRVRQTGVYIIAVGGQNYKVLVM